MQTLTVLDEGNMLLSTRCIDDDQHTQMTEKTGRVSDGTGNQQIHTDLTTLSASSVAGGGALTTNYYMGPGGY